MVHKFFWPISVLKSLPEIYYPVKYFSSVVLGNPQISCLTYMTFIGYLLLRTSTLSWLLWVQSLLSHSNRDDFWPSWPRSPTAMTPRWGWGAALGHRATLPPAAAPRPAAAGRTSVFSPLPEHSMPDGAGIFLPDSRELSSSHKRNCGNALWWWLSLKVIILKHDSLSVRVALSLFHWVLLLLISSHGSNVHQKSNVSFHY